jgi:hypothetical protein
MGVQIGDPGYSTQAMHPTKRFFCLFYDLMQRTQSSIKNLLLVDLPIATSTLGIISIITRPKSFV